MLVIIFLNFKARSMFHSRISICITFSTDLWGWNIPLPPEVPVAVKWRFPFIPDLPFSCGPVGWSELISPQGPSEVLTTLFRFHRGDIWALRHRGRSEGFEDQPPINCSLYLFGIACDISKAVYSVFVFYAAMRTWMNSFFFIPLSSFNVRFSL